MSITAQGPDAQEALFAGESAHHHVPQQLKRATIRLEFPPSYVLVGVYRLFTDKNLYIPAWDKCRHGTRRGAIVGAIWVSGSANEYSPILMNEWEIDSIDFFDTAQLH